MNGKKRPGRFTLQFNLEDPQQRTVSDLLEQQGRHKAQFLTSAVLCYIQQPSPQGSSGLPAMDEASLEEMLLSIIEKHPQFASALSEEQAKTERPSAQALSVNTWGGPMGTDAMAAISETLAAFQEE